MKNRDCSVPVKALNVHIQLNSAFKDKEIVWSTEARNQAVSRWSCRMCI